jgi:ubiquinone/menaquinone biosynthesis C-methylase UbiE
MTTTTAARSGTRDPYARIADLDEASVAKLAERIELRAADPRQRQLWRDFLSRAPYVADAQVLEVGCGTGVITAEIAGLPGVAGVVGVDPGPGFVDRARRRVPSARFEVADGRALPFADDTFDGVVFATTLCHVTEPERALAEAGRVLRPGGYLLVYDGDYATATVALAHHDPLQACIAAAIDALVNDPWLVRGLTRLLGDAGFDTPALRSHGHIEADSPVYLWSMVDFGADVLTGQGVIAASTGAALKAEARHRADEARFFGHIAYASALATHGRGATRRPSTASDRDCSDRYRRSPGEGLGADTAPRHEGGQSEIDQVSQHELDLVAPDACDHRANHDDHQTEGGKRHQNRCDVERGGQDQAHRSQDFEGSDGLDAAGAEVVDPSAEAQRGDLLLGNDQLADAANEERNGKHSGNDPQSQVHGVSP